MKKKALFLLFVLLAFRSQAVDLSSGLVRLTLYEDIGRFSLACMGKSNYMPLFSARDPRTSYLAVMVNKKVYRMGESTVFRMRLEGGNEPAFIYESPYVRVTERFMFITTAGSKEYNGVRVSLTAENIGGKPVDVGFKMLIDTYLDEGRQGLPLKTDRREINGETVISGGDGDKWWVSANREYALMGSISQGVMKQPDLIHFSNWKRLESADWRSAYAEGRRFNYTMSIGDSAAAYFFEPETLAAGERRVCELLLASADEKGFMPAGSAVVTPSSKQEDLEKLDALILKLDEYLTPGSTATEDDVAAIEAAIRQLREKYR